MTFAELVIKFETQGNDKALRDVRSIEVELKKVSSSSVNAANKISSSMTRIGQSSKSASFFQTFGSTVNNQFQQAAASTVPFGNNLLELVQTFALLSISSKSLKSSILSISTEGIAGLATGLANVSDKFGKFIQKRRDIENAKIAPLLPSIAMGTITDDNLKFVEKIQKTTMFLESLRSKLLGVNRSLANFASGAGVAGSGIEKFAAGLASTIMFLGNATGFLIGATAAMIAFTGAAVAMNLAIAKSTVEAAFNFEQLQARLSALTTPEKATDILGFVRKLAEPSNFTTQQLAEASVQLEAFGLNSKRILPIMAQLGMAFGADSEKLRLLTDMFGRLSQGQLPDAQVMAQFGISKSKLMKEGIKFDNQGSLLSSTREVMVAIEKIVTRDYGKIFDKMANTGNAKLASLTDVFERLKISVGMQLAETAKGAISSFTNVLTAIEKSGLLERAAKSMLIPFEALGKAFGAEGNTGIFSNAQIQIASFVGTFIAGFEELNIQTGLFIERMGLIGKLVADFATMNPQTAVKNFAALAKNLTGTYAPSRMIEKGTDYSMSILANMQNQGPGVNIKDLIKDSKLTDFGKLEDLLKGDKSKKDKNQRTLDLIQQNTKTQNEITLRNLTYGGGELAAQGLSAVQMSGLRSVSSPGINASNDIVRGVEKIVRGYSNSNNLNFSFKRS
jgi:hypothetical protein